MPLDTTEHQHYITLRLVPPNISPSKIDYYLKDSTYKDICTYKDMIIYRDKEY